MLSTKTISKIFLERCKVSKNANAIGWIEQEQVKFFNFDTYKKLVESITLGLKKFGVEPGEKVAILSHTCKEWNITDLGVICLSAVVVPIYPTYSLNDINYILDHSEASVLVIENDEQFKKLIPILPQMSKMKLIISFNDLNEENKKEIQNHISFFTFEEISAQGLEYSKQEQDLFENLIEQQGIDHPVSIVYTSGTTGEPKGAILTHQSFTVMLQNVTQHVQGGFTNRDRTLTFLPLSHVFGRCDSFLILIFGWEMVFAESIDHLLANINLVKPTVMLAVPRIFEKIYNKIQKNISEASLFEKQTFEWALGVAKNYFYKLDQDLSPSALELIQFKLAYKLVFEKIYNLFGGNIRFFVSGGASLSSEISTFLRYCNLTILEGYGLTETCAPVTLNQLNRQILGSVGTPIGDVQISFANDGEILIKSQCLFKGYYKNEAATNEAFHNGWFYSGDIGEFNDRGFLVITDRKKDLIATSGGKKIAPQKIENLMKTKMHISQFIPVGEKRNYLIGLVGIEKSRFVNMLDELSLPKDCTIEDLAKSPRVHELIWKEVEEVNQELAHYETIKKIAILPEEISVESGLLTPSLKVRRKKALERYINLIDALYQHD